MKIKIKGNNNQIALKGNINNIIIPIYKQEKNAIQKIETKNIFSTKILELIHEINKYDQNFGLETLAFILKLNSVSELTMYFNTKNEPSYSFLDTIAEKIFISKNWLKFSRGNIFDGESIKTFWITDLYEILKQMNFENIYILLNDSPNQELLILIEKEKYIYQKYYKTISVHPNIGNEGKTILYKFYLFMKKINSDSDLYLKTTEYILPENIFKSILCGELYPGAIFREKECTIHFCEDLLDLNHKYFTKEEYINMYGENFIKCQEIIIERKNKKT